MTAPSDAPARESAPYLSGERIERIVEWHAARAPHDVAVAQDDRTMTYAELTARARAVARALGGRGIGPGDYVPVLLERSPELVVALLGVLTAGAAYVAVDTGWPPERIEAVVRRSNARIAIAPPEPGPVIGGCERLPWPAAEAPGHAADLPSYVDGTAAACVFYTSGSTGSPKGVVSPHRGTVRTLVDNPAIPLDRTTVFLQAAPLPWDGFSLELWAALLNGGRCVLLSRGSTALDADALRDAVRRGVNSMWLTSSLFSVFADESPELLGRLRLLMVGGERVSVAHVRDVLGRFPGLHLVNGYGPAESTIFATTHRIGPKDVAAGRTDIPIGRPIPRTGVMLVGPDGGRVAPSAVGEVAISGDGLAIEYLGDPEETARRFVDLDGVRHYRTGDLAAWDDDGNLRFRGRADRQIKIRGVRIEPGEVESVIEGHPAVASCHVMPVEPVAGRSELACLYTTVNGAPLRDAELRHFASRTLPGPMVPTTLCHLPQLPLGVTGKIDQSAAARHVAGALARRRPGPDPAAGAGTPSSTDSSSAGRLLADTRALLDLPSLAAHDDLIDAGLTSLDAVRLAARLAAWGRVRITVGDVYRLRTLERLVAWRHSAPPGEVGLPLTAPDSAGVVPLTHAQRRFWMAEQSSPGAADNLVVLAYLLTGRLAPDTLERALHDVILRHSALRTVYPRVDGLPVQHVRSAGEIAVRLERWDGLPVGPPGDVAALAQRAAADLWRRPFALAEEIPLRARLCRVNGDRHLLVLQIHHIAFDGWSESILIEDLGRAYAARVAGTEPDFGPGTTYADYARGEHERVDHWIREDLPFWRDLLRDPPGPLLPAPGTAGEAARHERTLRIEPGTVERLTRAAGRHSGPVVCALLAATARALTGFFGRPGVCLGTVTAGRFDPALEPVVGYLVNPLAVPLAGPLDLPDEDLLTLAAQRVVAAMEHSRAPFDELVRALKPERRRHPWFQIWSVLQKPAPHGPFAPGLIVDAVRVVPPTTAAELVFEALPQPGGGWEVVISWRADGLTDHQSAQLCAGTGAALERIAALASRAAAGDG
jgi:amino acid adenylation domain-containing protein